MLAAGTLVVLAFLAVFGIPLLEADAGTVRYHNYFSASNTTWPFALNRAKELIHLSVSFLAVGILCARMSRKYYFIVAPAFVALVLTAHRTPIVMTFVFVGLALLCMRRKAALGIAGAGLVLYVLSAAFFLASSGHESEFSAEGTMRSMGFGLPEVRDLAWVLSSHPNKMNGLTYVVAFLPIPTWATEFTNTYRIRTVTLLAAGISLDTDGGGFRLTLGGENYINFGTIGVVIGGLLYGIGCRIFSNLFYWSDKYRLNKDPVLVSVLVSLWLLYSFLFYLSGSGISGPIKSEIVFVFILVMHTQRKRSFVLQAQTA